MIAASARKVLSDCQVALEMLETEQQLERWRVVWVSTVALIRGVGNVLATADCKTPFQRKVYEIMLRDWQAKPEHEIFREFIMAGRSMVIDDYVPDANHAEAPLDLHQIEHDISIELNYNLLDMRKKIAPTNYRKGEDILTIVKDAIEWWEQQIAVFEDACAAPEIGYAPSAPSV
jgi:hypothetical protein